MGSAFDSRAAGVAGLVPCWSCKGPLSVQAIFCHTCGAIQPPGQLNHFQRLGMPQSFDLDLDTLEKRYIGFQRSVHPDRFAAKPAKERAMAESQAVSLNEAYEALRDPLTRAAYLIQLKGGQSSSIERDETIRDPELLMEAMELREALSAAESVRAVEELAAKAGGDAIALLSQISRAFDEDDLPKANRLVIRFKYLRKFLSETKARLIALETM